MKGIRQIIAEMGVDLDEGRLDELDKAVAENYATRAELDEKRERISKLSGQIEELTERVGGAEADSEKVQALQRQLDEFRAAEREREEQRRAEADRSDFESRLDQEVGGRSFANDLTRKAIYAAAYETHVANPDMGAADALRAATEGQSGVWANPQTDPAKMPIPSAGEDKKADRVGFANALFGGRRQ